jgi:hypothetical protein
MKTIDVCSETNATKYKDCEGLETISSDWECCYNKVFEKCVNADPERLNKYVDCQENYINKSYILILLLFFIL